MSDDQGLRGAQTPNSSAGDYNAQTFVIMQVLARVRTTQLVKIVAVTNAGELSPVGFVDVQPMVHQLDGFGQPVPHAVVYGIPYFRMQGGANAIVLDPQIDDTGICVFADRDISSVKATGDFATPGSARQFNMADGLYLGGVLNGVPEQYVQFSDTGIKMYSPHKITLEAVDEIELIAPVITMNASTSTTITTPTFTVNGVSQFNGAVHGDSTIDAATSVTAPIVEGTTDVIYAGHHALPHIHTGGTILGKTGPTV